MRGSLDPVTVTRPEYTRSQITSAGPRSGSTLDPNAHAERYIGGICPFSPTFTRGALKLPSA
jgi:hypothetical protein